MQKLHSARHALSPFLAARPFAVRLTFKGATALCTVLASVGLGSRGQRLIRL